MRLAAADNRELRTSGAAPACRRNSLMRARAVVRAGSTAASPATAWPLMLLSRGLALSGAAAVTATSATAAKVRTMPMRLSPKDGWDGLFLLMIDTRQPMK